MSLCLCACVCVLLHHILTGVKLIHTQGFNSPLPK